MSECPEDDGFFADALQCDRYYECDDGEVRSVIIKTTVFVQIVLSMLKSALLNVTYIYFLL